MNRKPTRDFIYYLHDGAATFRFKLAGELSSLVTPDLEQARQTVASILGCRSLVVDVTDLSSVDASGRSLLLEWRKLGASLAAVSRSAQERLQHMLGVPVVLLEEKRPFRWLPLLTASVWFAVAVFLLALAALAASERRTGPASGMGAHIWTNAAMAANGMTGVSARRRRSGEVSTSSGRPVDGLPDAFWSASLRMLS